MLASQPQKDINSCSPMIYLRAGSAKRSTAFWARRKLDLRAEEMGLQCQTINFYFNFLTSITLNTPAVNHNKMKKSQPIALYATVAVAALLILWIFVSYNSLVQKQINTEGKWAQVETQYQRRVDLIPNLVESVKGYAQFEKSTLTELTELRSKWTNAKSAEERVDTANQLDSAISRLLLVYENYPNLKTVETVNNLMVQLEGTENRISVARRDYNEAVQDYNTATRTFPSNMVAGIFGFKQKTYFEAQEGAENAPKVNLTI